MILQDHYSSNKTTILNHFGTVTIAKNNFAISLKRTISSIMDIQKEPIKGFQWEKFLIFKCDLIQSDSKIGLGEDRQLPLGSPIDLIWIFREGLGGVKPFLLSQGEMFNFKVTGRLNVDFKALYHILHIFEDFFTSIYCRVMLVHRNVLTDPLKDILNEKYVISVLKLFCCS